MTDVLQEMDGISPTDIAERWFARLMSPDCTLRERERFEAWLAQSPENALAFEDTRALWADLEGLDEDEVVGPEAVAALEPQRDGFMDQWAKAAERVPDRAAPVRRRRWRAIAAGIAATLAVGLFLHSMQEPQDPPVTYASSGKIESVQLADGSSVQLDLVTSIGVSLAEDRRDIELLQGRAVFFVAKDASRPFVVDAGVGTVTALGTRFEVERKGERVAVTLLQGAVGISTAGDRRDPRLLRLAPGQRASYTPATRSWTVEVADVEALTSWSQGFHAFEATPLQQAIDEINRYSDLKLVLDDPALATLVMSGSYKLGDGGTLSQALPYALPVKVEQREGKIVISRR